MEKLFVTSRERRPHSLSFRRSVPVRGCRDRSGVRRKAHEHSVLSISQARQLSNIPFTVLTHFRGPRVSQMRVVSPNCDLGRRTAKMIHQRIERLHHMLIAEVPRPNPAREHFAVITLRILSQPRVLRSHKSGVRIQAAILAGQFARALLHFYELVDGLFFTTLAEPKTRCISVRLRVLAKMFKAGIAIASSFRRIGIDLVQKVEYRPCRGMQTVQIEA